MRVACYCRVSKGSQTFENQRLQIQQYLGRMGETAEVQWFVEKESTRNTRPTKEALLKLLRTGVFDSLVIVGFDRWARSTVEMVTELQSLHDRGVNVVSLREGVDLSTAQGRFFLTVLAGFAELERDLIRERTLAGIARARAQGKHIGRPRKPAPVSGPKSDRGIRNP